MKLRRDHRRSGQASSGHTEVIMPVVGKSRRLPRLARLSLWLILMAAVACSRPSDFLADDGINQGDHSRLPFQDNANKNAGKENAGKGPGDAGSNSGEGISEEASGSRGLERDPRGASSPPFATLSPVPELPPGTLVTVRLEKQISGDRIGGEGSFSAVVAEPVMVDGKMAVPRGAAVAGRIESARDPGPGRGYIRLTLDTIVIAGKTLPVRTSSLFVRGNAGEVLDSGPDQEQASPTATRLQKGRRLTFRLAGTVPLDQQETVSRSRSHLSGTE
jgi:hypothetical protein